MSKNRTETRKIELVETGNIALSLLRLRATSPYDSVRWKRALYHAMAMSYTVDSVTLTRIREALELP